MARLKNLINLASKAAKKLIKKISSVMLLKISQRFEFLTVMTRYHLFIERGYILKNNRAHDVYRMLQADPNVTCHRNAEYMSTIRFIIQHRNDEQLCVLLFQHQYTDKFYFRLLNQIASFDNIKLKVLFFTFDFWPRNDSPWCEIWPKIFKAQNHYVQTFALNVNQLSEIHDFDYTPYQDQMIFVNLWSCYEAAQLPFNDDPICKIAVSGTVDPFAYPDRHKLTSLISELSDNIIRLPYLLKEWWDTKNSYNHRLHDYLCCFASPVYIRYRRQDVRGSSRIILLKYLEILGAGALLLCPNTEEEQLNKIGLFSHQNCIICDMDDISQTIEYILDPENREKIDELRRTGQEHAIQNLNSQKKYSELMSAMDSVLWKVH